MTKLLQNKTLIKFLGIALSILLIVALIPQIGIAYGSKDDVVGETPMAETGEGDEATDEGEEAAADGDEAATPEEGTEPGEGEDAVEGEVSVVDGVEMVSHKVEVPGEEDEDTTENAIAPQSSEDEGGEAARVKSRMVLDLSQQQITIDRDTDYTSGPLTFDEGVHTLTIEEGCTFTGDILITGGAQVTINGKGTIKGTGNGSVIVVEGANDGTKLTFDGPTVTGGTGTVPPKKDAWGKTGGGILVCRSNTWTWTVKGAALEFKSGTIRDNTAEAGGGIFVDYQCGFTMSGGSVLNNTATNHEGGGIFTWGNWNGKTGDESLDYGHITAATIKGNETLTTTDWGGGGVYINNDGVLQIESARITNNTAESLGGGVAGCPHAEIGIGQMQNGAAVYGNNANGGKGPVNRGLKFNMPDSITYENKKVPSGDFLVQGLTTAEITALTDGEHTESLPYGSTSWRLAPGTYAKDEFDKDFARDFYCTYASFIAATNLKDHSTNDDGTTVAWEGFIASVAANKVQGNTVTEKSSSNEPNWTASYIEIPVNTDYELHDATLCLKSTASTDNSGIDRTVIIEENTSKTHGGGVACNGTLQFGTFPQKDEIVNNYTLSLDKEVVSGINDETLSMQESDTFEFVLVDNDDPKKKYKTTSTIVNGKGKIDFTDLPGVKTSTSVESPKTFTLYENLTEDQKASGFESTIPEEGVQITVDLSVESSSVTYGNMTTTTYNTTAGNIRIANEKTATVTNKLSPKASLTLPVTKIAYGIHKDTFVFDLNEIKDDPTLDDKTLKPGTSLADIAAAQGHKTVEIALDDSLTEEERGEKTFELGEYTEEGTYWYALAEKCGNVAGVSYDKTTYLVRVVVTLSEDGRTLNKQLTKWEVEPGSTDLKQVDPDVAVSFENVGMKYAGFNLDLKKQILTTLGGDIPLNDRTFNFALYDGAKEVAKGRITDGNSAVSLAITDESYARQVYAAGEKTTFTFTLKETLPEGADGSYMTTIPDTTVEVELSAAGERTPVNGHTMFLVTPTVESVTVNGTDVEVADKAITVTNRYAPHGEWQFQVDKYFYGLGDPRDCSFTMQEIERAPQAGEPLANVLVANDNLQKWTASAAAADFQNNKAAVVFDPIEYQVTVPKDAEADQNIPTAGDARGDHYYLITEDGDDAAKDTTAYVVKVTVAVKENDPGKLVATGTVLGYADDLNSVLNPMPEGETPAFYNTDTQHMISAASYSVYAASGEPVDQVCYVDPKIIKNLEGRAIKSGEFAFKLIEVANYNDTEGTVISATTNDEFGMVDFDKANNVSGDLENPSCLAYTKPGTYYYRVIEDTTKGGMNDQSVLYSDQVITFTTVIEQDEATGRLVCTDMYYGYWDKAANKNVRYDEQYTDFDTQPANIGDMSKLNPDWHPTITNKTRPMDIQVRKTSVTDRSEGLVGATYALYMVNENAQGDIKLAEATSEDGGWITYKNVSLSTNNLYYFKETAAPAGHTVSEFRSSYFYLVEDASSANGYALQYTDTKFLAEASAAAEPQAVALADETDAQAAAEAANKAAGNTETQPGHSADGNVLLTYDKDGGVYDEATQVEVNKLDTRTHEWVEGAKLVILEKESGKEIASWTSGKAPQKLEKTLNVGTTYLLREVEAPNQYRLANDVEFVIDDYGNVSITKGTENGNAELSDNSITLYDTMMDAEEVETVEREKSTTEKPKKDTLLAKTGDMLPILGIALVALAALIVVIVAVRRRRAGEDETTQS